ncbi:MAG TPA: RNA polymerase sigma factor [Steroidobacteraceae bacterium]|jgi:RNA polymerase sigma-70 factor (ECF subfamily)|nr:RNA polymerase sigma factor [Steroidobacteraceae bacterium]
MEQVAAAESSAAHQDRSMAHSIVAGDAAAFESMMRHYNRRLYRLARATLRDRTEAEDALQDAYICAYRAMGSFRGEASLGTWLSRLVLNECFARMRRTVRREKVVPLVSATRHSETHMIIDESDAPDSAAGRMQIRELLERKVDELPESYRTVFVLRSVEELTVNETAEALGIAEETVRSRHFRAKGLLRESLAREMDLAEPNLFEFGGDRCDRVVASVLARIVLRGNDITTS